MEQHNKIYQQAFYYDIALSRDVGPEVDFFLEAYRYYTGLELKSALEIACGPGYHSRTLAQRGIQTVGVDLRPEMITFAQQQPGGKADNLSWVVGDMRQFQLEQPVDMAVCMFDGFDPLLTNDDVIRHFHAVADNLNPQGLYLVQYTHPRYCSLQDYGSFHYEGERDNIKVIIHWAINNPVFDCITATAEVETKMYVCNKGQEFTTVYKATERLFSPQEFPLLAQLSNRLRVIGWHGDFDLRQPFDNSAASQYMLCLLQKI
ncbi:MAG: class I SAM-dependent methyltransferase [Anaerolineae bacterium]|nr:class I SAM-dependent methyltransferase [Anaerolineae bacterium]